MALSMVLALLALIGIIYGIANKRKTLVIASVIVFIIIAATMLYFYINLY